MLTLAEVESVSGEVGNFQINLKQRPRYIDPDRCTGCGLCKDHCPVTAINEFNEGLNRRKATYIQLPQAVPLSYGIDRDACIGCGLCEKICLAKAIFYSDEAKETRLNVGAIVLAPGSEFFKPTAFDTYNYAHFPNVITSLEFERILSAGGPYKGHLMRPYDLDEPRSIAWLQCVGSRDVNQCDNPYCSSVCCMYAIKQAVIAKEHARDELDTAIFFMDMRTHGKDFERYYERARQEHGVRFIRSRVHTVDQDPETKALTISYVDESGQHHIETFDIVVLSVGTQTPEGVAALAERLGVELNAYRFCATTSLQPVETSRPGIFVCGIFQGPKDIPSSVMEASAAACAASTRLVPARGTLVREKTYPEERDVSLQKPRVGVFVCNCGVNIGGVVRVPEVAEYAKTLPNVVYVQENLFSCSQDAQEQLRQVIIEQDLNRVVVAACTPRTHEPLFQETLKGAGLNKYLYEMVNIRDQDSWVHQNDPDAATEKAKDLVRMGVVKSNLLEPLEEEEIPIQPVALVVGGGLAGMQAALAIAESGYEVHLVEKAENLGGQARHIYWTWNGEEVQPFLKEMTQMIRNHPLITVHLNSEVRYSSGFVGSFQSTILSNGTKRETVTVDHGVVILATGATAYRPKEYLYGSHPHVLLWHELDERVVGRDPLITGSQCGVFIQCVGSREPEHPYCSRICCTHSVQTALKIKEINPEIDLYILYRDLRTYGFMESLYQEARTKGILFVRYDLQNKPQVRLGEDGGLEVEVFDHILRRPFLICPDFVNLATAIEPADSGELSRILKVPLNEDGFFMEAHAKLRPVDFASDGIFVCGLAHYPKSIEESLTQALAAAARAMGVLARKVWVTSGLTATINPQTCVGCMGCVEVCPYGAITFNEQLNISEVNRAVCKGCGSCAAACPSGSARLLGFTRKQLNAQVMAALR